MDSFRCIVLLHHNWNNYRLWRPNSPSDRGKLAGALYALIAVNVVGNFWPSQGCADELCDEWEVTFDSVDTDHSGTIERDELEVVQKKYKDLEKKYNALKKTKNE